MRMLGERGSWNIRPGEYQHSCESNTHQVLGREQRARSSSQELGNMVPYPDMIRG